MVDYYFYSDLSSTRNIGELSRISRVYKPLYEDVHNAVMIPKQSNYLMYSKIFDMPIILNNEVHKSYSRRFFKNISREQLAYRIWSDKSQSWQQLSDDEKNSVAKERADSHNKNINHIRTLMENTEIFIDMISYLREKHIKAELFIKH